MSKRKRNMEIEMPDDVAMVVHEMAEQSFLWKMFGKMMYPFRDACIEFMRDCYHGKPNSFGVLSEMHGKESGEITGYTFVSCTFSDDVQFMGELSKKISDLITKEVNNRYPTMMENTIIDKRNV